MYKYHVTGNELITPSVRLLTLTCDDAKNKPFSYVPGQYAAISLRDKTRPTTTRCFSIVSSPTQGSVLQFGIRVQGEYTGALERLSEGDKVAVQGPFGRFIFNEQVHHNVTMLAGGIGVAPFVSMLRYAADVEADSAIRLIYSCRSQDDIPFIDELRSLEQRNPNLRVTYVVEKGPTDRLHGAQVLMGYVDNTALNQLGSEHQDETYMLCGPPVYMDAMVKLLKARGVPSNSILTEAFSQTTEHQGSALAFTAFQTYAFSGVLFLVTIGLIIATDLLAAAPKLDEGYETFEPMATSEQAAGYDPLTSVTSIAPQVDTDITPEPIIVTVPAEKQTVSAPVPVVTPKPKPIPVVTPTPAPTPEPVVTPTPEPTPTVTPKKAPRTQVS